MDQQEYDEIKKKADMGITQNAGTKQVQDFLAGCTLNMMLMEHDGEEPEMDLEIMGKTISLRLF